MNARRPTVTDWAVVVGVAATIGSYPQVKWVGSLISPAWPAVAWLYPVPVDVLLALCAVLIVRDHPGTPERRWAWAGLLGFSAFSWACNAAHALHATGTHGWLAAAAVLAAGVLPAGLVVASHLAAYAHRAGEPPAAARAAEAPLVADHPADNDPPALAPAAIQEPGEPPVPLTPDDGEPEAGFAARYTPSDTNASLWAAYMGLRRETGEPPTASAILDRARRQHPGLSSLAGVKRRLQGMHERWDREQPPLHAVH